MSKYRLEQINMVVHQALSEIFTQVLEIPKEYLISITKVDTAPSLRTAKVFLSVLPIDKHQEGIAYIVRARKVIQIELGKRLEFKFTPAITYLYDDSSARAMEVDQILEEINKQGD